MKMPLRESLGKADDREVTCAEHTEKDSKWKNKLTCLKNETYLKNIKGANKHKITYRQNIIVHHYIN